MNNEWYVYETNDAVHIIPHEDLITHALNPFCICGPERDEYQVNSKPMYSHSSFDRREDDEEWLEDDDEEWEWEEEEDDEDW